MSMELQELSLQSLPLIKIDFCRPYNPPSVTPNFVILTTRRCPICYLFNFQFPLLVQCRPLSFHVRLRPAGDWGSGLLELHVYYWDEMTDSLHNEIGSGLALGDKSEDILDICGTTSSNMVAPRFSPIAASVTTKINNVISFVRQRAACTAGLFIRYLSVQTGMVCSVMWFDIL